MSRYRLTPTPSQEVILAKHCAHARFVWNLAVEQQSWWRPGRGSAPGFDAQCEQLTQARRSSGGWPQEATLCSSRHCETSPRQWRTFSPEFTAGRPGVAPTGTRAVSSPFGPAKSGGYAAPARCGYRRLRVRFRWSRAVPAAKSYRVTWDRAVLAGTFAAVPAPIPGPCTGQIVGIDRGVACRLPCRRASCCAALAQPAEQARLRLPQRKLARATKGSIRRQQTRIKDAYSKARRPIGVRTGLRRPYRSGAPVRCNPHRGPARCGHDRLGTAHSREARPECTAESRPQPRHPRQRLGTACPSSAKRQALPAGSKRSSRVHLPEVQCVRDRRRHVAQEPSRLRLPVLRIRCNASNT